MASIRKRGDKWEVRVLRKGEKSACKSFTLKTDAERFARQVEAAMDRGEWQRQQPAASQTLGEIILRYKHCVTPTKKGARQEHTRLQHWLNSDLANRSIQKIMGADIAVIRDKRLKLGRSNATVRLEISALSSVFQYARQECGYESLANPCMAIKRPIPNSGRARRLKPGELEAILAATDSLTLPSLALLAIETAARLGELVTLEWQQIDLAARLVKLSDTKNGDQRTIPLSGKAAKVLSTLNRNPQQIMVFDVRSHAVTVAWRRAVARAKDHYRIGEITRGNLPSAGFLEDIHFHDLRHEAVSRLFEKGLDATEVKAVSGHRTMAMLARYTHHKAERLVAKLAAFDGVENL